MLHPAYKDIHVADWENDCRISSVFQVLYNRFISFQTGGKKNQLATYKRKHYAQENNESSYIAGSKCKGHYNPIKISVHIRTG